MSCQILYVLYRLYTFSRGLSAFYYIVNDGDDGDDDGEEQCSILFANSLFFFHHIHILLLRSPSGDGGDDDDDNVIIDKPAKLSEKTHHLITSMLRAHLVSLAIDILTFTGRLRCNY